MKGTVVNWNARPVKFISGLIAGACLCAGMTGRSGATLFVNEVDSTSPGFVENTTSNAGFWRDAFDFVEIYSDSGSVPLDGHTLVLFNGFVVGDKAYNSIPLDHFSTDPSGFFVVGNPGVPGVDLAIPPGDAPFGSLESGRDAVGLYVGPFAINDPATATDLLDAVVYDSDTPGDPDDSALVATLTPGQPQISERGAGGLDFLLEHSIGRAPDGGIQRNTSTYTQLAPTPGKSNAAAADRLVARITSSDGANPKVMAETGGTGTLTVTRSGSTAADLEVTLNNTDISELDVPGTLTIPAGAESESVAISAVDDLWVDGDQVAYVSATAPGYGYSVALVTVSDDPADPAQSLVINEVHARVFGDANGDGAANDGDEFVEIVNVGLSTVSLEGLSLADDEGVRHEFGHDAVVRPGCALVVFAALDSPDDIGQTMKFGGAVTQLASTGALGLGDSNDTIRLLDDGGDEIAGHVFVPWGAGSNTRNSQDGSGPFPTTNHNDLVGSSGFFSPGETYTGAAFCTVSSNLTMTFSPACLGEAGADSDMGTSTLTISVPVANPEPTPIWLVNNDPSDIDLAATSVTIPADGLSVTVDASVIRDMLDEDDEEMVTVFAKAPGYFNTVSDPLRIVDEGTLSLNLSATSVVESAGTSVSILTIERSGSSGDLGLTVTGSADGVAKAQMTSLTIPDGSSSITVPIDAIAGGVAGSDETVEFIVVADADDCSNAAIDLTVISDGGIPDGPFINEIDSDQPGDDDAEYIELFVPGGGEQSLDGLLAVLYDGATDTSYAVIDLAGVMTNSDGFFVFGDAAAPHVDLVVPGFDLRDGPVAIAIYRDSGLVVDSPPTANNRLDVLIYGDTNDAALADALFPGTSNVSEGDPDAMYLVIGRSVDGGAGSPTAAQFGDATTYAQQAPTPGRSNESCINEWLVANNLSSIAGDIDGDCIPTILEYLLGSDPNRAEALDNPISFSQIDGMTVKLGSGVVKEGALDDQLLVVFEYSGDLAGWIAIVDAPTLDEGASTLTGKAPDPAGDAQYMRIKVSFVP